MSSTRYASGMMAILGSGSARVSLYGAMLVVFDFAGIWFVAWLRIWARDGVDARTPVIMVVASLTAGAGWFVLKRVPIRRLTEAAASWVLALLLGPAAFVPLLT